MTPRIVRVGVQAHHSVDSVTLETLVERKLATSADLRVGCSCVGPLVELGFQPLAGWLSGSAALFW